MLMIAALTQSIWASSLVDICQDALNNDPTYLAAQAEWLIAQQDLSLAEAELLPDIDLSWSGSKSKIFPRGTPSASGSSNIFTLSLTQPIFDAQALAALSQTKLSVQAARANLVLAAQSLLARSTIQYFNVVIAKERLETFKAQKKTARAEYILAKNLYKAGTKNRLNLYEAKANYDRTIADTIQAENNELIEQQNLTLLTNKQYKSIMTLGKQAPLVTINKTNQEKWVKLAKEQNYELKSAKLAYQAAKKGVYVASLERLPVINFTSGFSRDKINTYGPPGFFELHFKTIEAGVELTAPIYQGGRITANTEKAKANVLLAKAHKALTERQIVTDVKNHFQNILADIQNISARNTAVKSAKIDLQETSSAYSQGIRTLNDVSITMSELRSAQEEYINARYHYLISVIMLKNSAGMLSSDDIYNINQWLTKPTKLD